MCKKPLGFSGPQSNLLAKKFLLYVYSGMSGPKKPQTIKDFQKWVNSKTTEKTADNENYEPTADNKNSDPPQHTANAVPPTEPPIDNDATTPKDIAE